MELTLLRAAACRAMGSSLTEAHLGELKQIFELFDGDADGLLDVAEVGAILQLVGDTALTEAEVLDMVTEVAPEQRKLPFSEFVNIMCRPMVGKEALAGEIRKSFKAFAAEGAAQITAPSLRAGLAALGQPVSALVSEEMIREADVDRDGTVGVDDYVTTFSQ